MTGTRKGAFPGLDEHDLGRLAIRKLDAFVLRAPIATPVRTSFGTMTDRPAVFVRVTDEDGAEGWGEIWCNFPSVGAEHRAALASSVFQPLLTGHPVIHPADTFEMLTQSTAVLALQSGEPGPFAQVIAGIDLALWDLWARKADLPLWRLLGGRSDEIGVYASGLNPVGAEQLVREKAQQGYIAFKLKIGFGREQDLANVGHIKQIIGPDCKLMLDANQAWDLHTAVSMTGELESFGPGWLEEPMRCDRPMGEWQALMEHSSVPIAAGENLSGADSFHSFIESRSLSVIQPDAAKWGGISGCWPVITAIRAAGLRYCPHYLGGGVGLLASAHLLAAAGGDGLLEVDANPNPLRTLFSGPIASPSKGRVALGEAPGIGITPNIDELEEQYSHRAARAECKNGPA
ncbi:D-galactarolactone cycloisomerase [Paraburkholderia aspalathi]|uniref:mandelate racemase/muconate lactonizing enzyme family protein n=1 Tax=Paraburkholderia aspalathi TaxID=1324617 RepID=UPI00190B1FCA|nr:mandelate racemase/muconate lactonizing enzyme family protein [Paraburkholderia aspalathi]MBK3843696.1 mandelate racemase/muconate lactonizing enzyme family protein [Paraburkholderia aspalathi]CAE6858968.1 D-galactarolactone cycloisomerase [Paraburkholderia aspalathi]CAE6870235.1 D-galactarolactone cycloisomerase [Paraburkholderia aspalathi]